MAREKKPRWQVSVRKGQAMNDDDVTDVRNALHLVACLPLHSSAMEPIARELMAIQRHIDGEPARIAAAREEQREADAKFCPNCLGVGFVERPVPCPYCDDSTHDHYCPTGTQRQQCGCGAARIRATPLTATPLADEIATLRARVVYLEGELHETIGENADLVVRAEKSEAERDALRAQVEAARTYARQALDYGEDCDATDLLRAMDEAKEEP